MAATKADDDRWKKTAKKMGATHLISVCDTFDWSDYPVYVMPHEVLDEIKANYDGTGMQKINEIIDVSVDVKNNKSIWK